MRRVTKARQRCCNRKENETLHVAMDMLSKRVVNQLVIRFNQMVINALGITLNLDNTFRRFKVLEDDLPASSGQISCEIGTDPDFLWPEQFREWLKNQTIDAAATYMPPKGECHEG